MPEIITSQEIDPNVGINEVDIEVYEEIGWRGFSEQLAQDAAQANASLAVITDAEGQFVCLATREMAEMREAETEARRMQLVKKTEATNG